MTERPAAVLVDRACKYYGKPDKPDYKVVLDNLNMTVEKGIIYGLLGPSGCGKTTLLSCIVGRRKLNSGSVWLLGGKPGEKGSGVPGPKVGYMPQEIALVGEFTVRDAIFYFGRIYGLSPERLNDRFDFLTDLLELSDGGKLIKHLSGGQQRRVSLAAALVHQPELLILDEPCVGLDPVLRERIWEFLSGVARGGTTVIITTHYIDETKQAHKIGLLRDGQFLAEESPEEILRKFNCDTLEDAFYKLALRQTESDRSRPGLHSPDVIPGCNIPEPADSKSSSREDFSVVTSSTDVLTVKDKPKKSHATKSRYNAVFIKSLQQFCRNPGGLLFAITFPIVTAMAFFSAVGNDPRDLRVAVVNEEASFSPWGLDVCKNSSLQQVSRTADDTCQIKMLSCWFIQEMEKHNIYQIPYNTTKEALKQVERNALYGAMYIHPNFSEALAMRIREGHVADDVAESSSINVWLDGTNHQISHYLKRQFYKTYQSFTKRAMKACEFSEDLIQIPVRFHDPIYGDMDAQFVAFMAPGIMITIIFFLSAMVTSTLMIADRLEGVWERSCVAGVRPQEMLNVHILIQTVVIAIQTLEMIVVGFAGYGLTSKGSLFTAGVLLFLQGVSGMCYGFLLSIYSPNYTVCFFIVTGTFYPMILLCGILWPLQGMYYSIHIVALLMPFTIPTMSLRDIMDKGYTITDPSVYHGILTTLAWILITLGMCFLRLKFKKM